MNTAKPGTRSRVYKQEASPALERTRRGGPCSIQVKPMKRGLCKHVSADDRLVCESFFKQRKGKKKKPWHWLGGERGHLQVRVSQKATSPSLGQGLFECTISCLPCHNRWGKGETKAPRRGKGTGWWGQGGR